MLVLVDVALLGQRRRDRPDDHGDGPLAAALRHRLHRRSAGGASGAGAAIVAFAAAIYAWPIPTTAARRYGFYPFLMLLMAGVSGAFLTGDIFNLYVWFEVLLISSFGLLVLGSERAADRRRG